ncbi:MAG TPA: DUF3696 domain-containing protein, partial [Gallicola sp.]|nr:DUF3696 domain-containing protein [Gallicola sp.]
KEIEVEFSFLENKENKLGNGVLQQIRLMCEGENLYTIKFGDGDYTNESFCYNNQLFKQLFDEFLNRIDDGSSFNFDFDLNEEEKNKDILFKILGRDSKNSKSIHLNSAYHYIKNASKDTLANLYSFFELLNGVDALNNTLFYTPAYEYLKDATKENIDKLIYEKIDNTQRSDNLILHLENVADLFIKSEHTYFKDYFKEMEDAYLLELSSKWCETAGLFSKYDEGSSDSSFLKGVSINRVDYINFSLENIELSSSILNTKASVLNLEQLYAVMYKFSDYIESDYCENNRKVLSDNYYSKKNNYLDEKEYVAIKKLDAWFKYIELLLEDAVFNLPDFLENVDFINSNRPKVERFYDLSNQNEGFGLLIKEYVSKNNRSILLKDKKEYKLGDFLRKWVKEFEIADDVVFEITDEGSGIFIYLVTEGRKTLLADLGYGITQVLSMLLKIELSILNNFELAGYIGFSSYYGSKEQTLTIEEPEANLHPMFQSKLADMFMEANELYNINFILETHSEYLIRKLQYLVANPEHSAKAEDISIYYMYHPDKIPEGQTQVVDLEIRPDGLLKKDFGEGFFDEASSWTFELLKLQSLN